MKWRELSENLHDSKIATVVVDGQELTGMLLWVNTRRPHRRHRPRPELRLHLSTLHALVPPADTPVVIVGAVPSNTGNHLASAS